MIQLAVINASTAATDAEVQKVMAAAQKHLDRDFSPAWGLYAQLRCYTHADAVAGKIPAGAWWMSVLDDADQAGALGYHDLAPGGAPLAKVFWRTTLRAGLVPSVTLCHELDEMLGDPEINLTVIIGEGKHAMAYARELCDAPEDDKFGYDIDGVRMSDFVLPLWFVPGAPKGARLDFGGHIQRPLELLEGGYIGVMPVSTGLWRQEEPPAATLGARHLMTRHGAQIHSRHERRTKPRAGWRNSELRAA